MWLGPGSGSRDGPVVSGAAPLGCSRPPALYFNLPLRGESITCYITFFLHLHPKQRKQHLKCAEDVAGNSAVSSRDLVFK